MDSALVTLILSTSVRCIRDSQSGAGGPLLTCDASATVRKIGFVYKLELRNCIELCSILQNLLVVLL